MQNSMKLLGTAALAALIWLTVPGCSKPQPLSLETHTVDGPRQVRQGLSIEPRSITVWGIYKGGSRKVVNVGSGNITFNSHTPGPQMVKVRVGSQEASFRTEVMALRSLTIASLPNTLIKQGQEPDPKWPGLEVRGEWDQMGSDRIPIASCRVTGYAKDQVGRQTIRVSYEGMTATFDVEVIGMTGIQIAQPPLKRDYAQYDPLDLAGLRVMGVWEGFPSERLEITWDDITGFNAGNVGIQRVVVTKGGMSASFDVEVLALTSIVLDKPPTKTDYKVGESLDLKGIMIYGNYTGSSPNKKITIPIPVSLMSVSGYDSNRVGTQQRVTITVRGQVANFFVNISEAAADQSSSGRRR